MACRQSTFFGIPNLEFLFGLCWIPGMSAQGELLTGNKQIEGTTPAEDTLPAQIAEQLRRDILRGKLAPGATIKERDNAAEMGVSRTPMREAIRILATEGLVLLRPARSPIVARPSFKQIADNIEVLTALELLSADLACQTASDAQIAAVAEAQERLERNYDLLDAIDIFEMDMAFHIAIAKASNNQVLIDTHRAILARMWRARYLSARRTRSRERVIRQHNLITEGLQRRDPEMVRQNLQDHLEHLLANVREYFEHAEGETPSDPQAAQSSA